MSMVQWALKSLRTDMDVSRGFRLRKACLCLAWLWEGDLSAVGEACAGGGAGGRVGEDASTRRDVALFDVGDWFW